ncbi:PQQ-dependent sugar dehydrogenase [Halobaculum sp. MBLA0147]|uniref:PQQ-dependent sugar dehydrogenase n=1 Tax=Halobaculum sp. MBLA0147 TaxID=3079934 RepID=UPI00352312D8
MDRRDYLAALGAATTAGVAGCTTFSVEKNTEVSGSGGDGGGGANGDDSDGSDGDGDDRIPTPSYTVETVTTGLASPWSVTTLPGDDRLLVTQQGGSLRLVDPGGGATTPVDGAPSVFARGQGGLLDAAVHPSYPEEPWLYLTYSVAGSDGESSTAVGRGRLDTDAGRLRNFERLHAAEPFVESSGHYGSRAVFGPDDLLYVSVGDRQFKNFGPDHVGQRVDEELGCILRLRPDGSVPESNPFVDDPDARDTIFSYGHRNPQGLTVHPETGAIWESEYGEQDGDEINVLEAGGNYGWPVADEGCTYGSGDPIGVSHDDREDVIAPVFGWPCGSGGFPPSGTTFYTGDRVSGWTGDLFVAGTASRAIARFVVDGTDVRQAPTLLEDRNQRLRDVETGPDGYLYAIVDAGDAPLLRLKPA